MFWMILALLVNIALGIAVFRSMVADSHSSEKGACLGATVVVLLSFNLFLFMIGGLILEGTSAGLSYEDRSYEINIYSLRSEEQVSGSFVIGSGTIDSREYYYFFRDHGDNAFIRGKVRASSTPIIEDDHQDPHLLQERRVVSSFNPWFVGPGAYFRGEDYYLGRTEGFRGQILRNTLIVPEGTIVQEFRVE